jgi:hypothetical protein
VVVSVLRAVARRRLVKTKNPSARATVCWKVCKSEIARCCLYVHVITCACITQLLINPIIRTRTRLISVVYQPYTSQYYKVYRRCYATIVRSEVISDSFLGNGSVTPSPQQRLRMQRGIRGVVYVVRAEENWGNEAR